MNKKTKAILLIIFSAILTGAQVPMIKLGFSSIPPFTYSFLRFSVASLIMLPFLVKEGVKINSEFGRLLTILSLAVINIVVFAIGLQTTTAVASQLLYSGSPIMIGIIMYLMFGRKLSRARWLYILLGFLGFLIIILTPGFNNQVSSTSELEGNLLVAFGVICWSVFLVLSEPVHRYYSPMVIVTLLFFACSVVFFVLSLSELSQFAYWTSHLTPVVWLGILYVSAIGTVVSYLLNQYIIKYGGPMIAGLSLYLLPPMAYFYSFLLLGEQLTVGLIVGTVLIFISIFLMSFSK